MDDVKDDCPATDTSNNKSTTDNSTTTTTVQGASIYIGTITTDTGDVIINQNNDNKQNSSNDDSNPQHADSNTASIGTAATCSEKLTWAELTAAEDSGTDSTSATTTTSSTTAPTATAIKRQSNSDTQNPSVNPQSNFNSNTGGASINTGNNHGSTEAKRPNVIADFIQHAKLDSDPNTIKIAVNATDWFKYVSGNNADIHTNPGKRFELYNRYIHMNCSIPLHYNNHRGKSECLIEMNTPERVSIASIDTELKTFSFYVGFKTAEQVATIKQLLDSKKVKYRQPTKPIAKIRFGPITELKRLSNEEFIHYFTSRGFKGTIERNYWNGRIRANAACYEEDFESLYLVHAPSNKPFHFQRIIQAEIRLCFHCKGTDHLVNKCPNKQQINNSDYHWCIECGKYHEIKTDSFGEYMCINNTLSCRLCNKNHLVRECRKAKQDFNEAKIGTLLANIAKRKQQKEFNNLTNENRPQQQIQNANGNNKQNQNSSQSPSWSHIVGAKSATPATIVGPAAAAQQNSQPVNDLFTKLQFDVNHKIDLINSKLNSITSDIGEKLNTIMTQLKPAPVAPAKVESDKNSEKPPSPDSIKILPNNQTTNKPNYQQLYQQQLETNKQLQESINELREQLSNAIHAIKATPSVQINDNQGFSEFNSMPSKTKKRSKLSTPSKPVEPGYERSNKFQALSTAGEDLSESDENIPPHILKHAITHLVNSIHNTPRKILQPITRSNNQPLNNNNRNNNSRSHSQQPSLMQQEFSDDDSQ
jgi:hypothetical protein